eukprot:m.212749 g.212749  ORF g.212749 m.212749 type:complete len:1370 (+) comp15569_c0_seq10:60-4169(+)
MRLLSALLFFATITVALADAAGEPIIESVDGNLYVQVDADKQVVFNTGYGQVLINNSAVVTEAVLAATLSSLRSELIAYFLGPDVNVQIALSSSGAGASVLASATLAAPPRFNMQPIETAVGAMLAQMALCVPAGGQAGASLTLTVTAPSGTATATITPSTSSGCLSLAAAASSVTNSIFPMTSAPLAGGLLGRLTASLQTQQTTSTTTLNASITTTATTLSAAVVDASTATAALGVTVSTNIANAASNLASSASSGLVSVSTATTALGAGISTNVATLVSNLAASTSAGLVSVSTATAALGVSASTSLVSLVSALNSSTSTGLASASTATVALGVGISTNVATQVSTLTASSSTGLTSLSTATAALGVSASTNIATAVSNLNTSASTATAALGVAMSTNVATQVSNLAASSSTGLATLSTATVALGVGISTNIATQVSNVAASSSTGLASLSTATAALGVTASTNIVSLGNNLNSTTNTGLASVSSATAAVTAAISTNVNALSTSVSSTTNSISTTLTAALSNLAQTVSANMFWRSDFGNALYGPEFTFNVSVMNATNGGVVGSVNLTGPATYGAVTTNQFLANFLNTSSVCRTDAQLTMSVVGNGITLATALLSVNATGVCQPLASVLAALPAAINWPTAAPTAGVLGRVYTAVRSTASASNVSLSTAAATLSTGIASVAAIDALTTGALSGAVSTLQGRASTSERAITTLSDSLASQITAVYTTIGTNTNTTNLMITAIASDLNLTRNLSTLLNNLTLSQIQCHERGLVFSRTSNTCRSPISVVCGEGGPSLGAGFAPTLGSCRSSNVFGAPQPCSVGCASGFTLAALIGNYTCGADGQWALSSAVAPVCNAVSCGTINLATVNIVASTVDLACTGTTFGQTCTATCKAGFDAGSVLSTTLTCGASGQWSGARVVCPIRSCGNLVQNTVINSLSGTCAATTFGSVCSMTCAQGYGFAGVTALGTYTCSATGAWSLTSGAAPNCPATPNVWAVSFADPNPGCPNSVTAWTPLYTQVFRTGSTSTMIWVAATAIRQALNRAADLYLTVDNLLVAQALPFTPINTWISARLYYAGVQTNPTMTMMVNSNGAAMWGCSDGSPYDRFFSIGISASMPIRQVVVYDTRSGCPLALAANTAFLTASFVSTSPNTIVFARAHIIRSFLGRSDLFFNLNGALVSQSISYTGGTVNQWEDMSAHHLTSVGLGTHTFTVTGSTASTFGCGPQWGAVDLMIVDDYRVVKWWNVQDTLAGCPGTRAAGAAIMSLTFTQVSSSAVLWVAVSIIRYTRGRADLILNIDGTPVNRAITFTELTLTSGATAPVQWSTGYVFFSGTLAAGSHTVTVTSDVANVWGCGTTWGNLNAILVGDPMAF